MILISYFYQLRFFAPNIIPFSTAVWDPQWYHQGRGNKHIYLDKNGVVNGLRYEPFVCIDHDSCRGPEKCESNDPNTCKFLTNYREQLMKVSKEEVFSHFDKVVENLRKRGINIQDPVLCFMVYETPKNTCSERWPLMEWCNKNNITCREFSK